MIVNITNNSVFLFSVIVISKNGKIFYKIILGQLISDNIHRKYKIIAKIGTGKFCNVYFALSKISGNKYAIKTIEKAKIEIEEQKLIKSCY